MIALRLLKWGCGSGALLTFCGLLTIALISLQSCGWQITNSWQMASDYDPTEATCENAGLVYPDNPFVGWPTSSANAINYYYCSADYYAEFGRTHWGIDINTYRGEPVYATTAATVVWAYYDPIYGMGRTVKLCTSSGWCAIYMHLDGFAVVTNQYVSPGQVIAYADSTGFSTGDHLHYQLEDPAGQPVDPYPAMIGG